MDKLMGPTARSSASMFDRISNKLFSTEMKSKGSSEDDKSQNDFPA